MSVCLICTCIRRSYIVDLNTWLLRRADEEQAKFEKLAQGIIMPTTHLIYNCLTLYICVIVVHNRSHSAEEAEPQSPSLDNIGTSSDFTNTQNIRASTVFSYPHKSILALEARGDRIKQRKQRQIAHKLHALSLTSSQATTHIQSNHTKSLPILQPLHRNTPSTSLLGKSASTKPRPRTALLPTPAYVPLSSPQLPLKHSQSLIDISSKPTQSAQTSIVIQAQRDAIDELVEDCIALCDHRSWTKRQTRYAYIYCHITMSYICSYNTCVCYCCVGVWRSLWTSVYK